MNPIDAVFQNLRDVFGPRPVDPKGSGALVLTEDQSIQMVHRDTRPRRHTFHDLETFAAFLNRHDPESRADILFDGDRSRVVADLEPNMQSPAADVLTCQLQAHPRRKRWTDLLGRELTQKRLFQFLATAPDEDFGFLNNDTRQGSLREYLASGVRQLQASKGVTFESVLDPRGFYGVRGGSNEQSITAKLPSDFVVTLPWFAGLDYTYGLPMMLTLDVDEKKGVIFRLEAPSMELVHAEAVRDAVGHLRAHLDDGFLVCLGEHRAPDMQAT